MDKRTPARILIVDDEPVMLTITQSILSQHDFEVSTAESAEEALALIDNGYLPDLVLLDVLMPGMNGFDACCLLRQQTHFEYLPIIMLTALDDQESIDRAYRCGATDFITKPLNIPLLPHRVRYLLRSSSAIRNVVESELALLNTQRIAHLGNWLMNRQGEVTAASRQYLEIIGGKILPISPRQLIDRVHPEDREALVANRLQLASGRPYQIDYRLLGRNADPLTYVHERGFPSFDGNGAYSGASGYIQDITERVVQEQKIRDLAWHDHLTGFNNRGRLTELIERELETDQENLFLAIFFIQIANLPEISKILGQDQADLTVKTLASRLNGILNNPEVPHEGCAQCFDCDLTRAAKIGRYDEQAFVIAMPRGQDIESMRCFAQMLQHSLTRPMVLHGQEFFFKVSIGIALYPQDATDASELMRRAMLVAHNAAGREGHAAINFFDPQHDREASQRLALERGLRIALEQGGQLQPYFQPKISAETGEMIGAEVLLRWIHPTLGLISPAQFIPLAEEIGLIHPISEWLIAHVCEQIASWRQQGLEVGKISINLSADSFFQQSLTGDIDAVLARTGVPPGQLIIELTESVLMQDAEAASHVIGNLRERGISVSLDDFGTGFSSLGYLNRFAIDEIKIDRSFVIDLEVDTKERALVQAIITLGHALGIKVVAEGVETPRQAELLRTMGCDIFQGFLFARPMPVEAFAEFRGHAARPAGSGTQAG